MIGQVLHYRYELERRLGEGPLFLTFTGKDRIRSRAVVLKVLKPQFNASNELRSAVTAYAEGEQPSSAGFVQVLGHDEHEGHPFLVTDLANGMPLSDRIKRVAPMTVSVAVDVAIGIAQALDSAHRSGMVHGNLRPSNVIVAVDGAVKLTDFGLRGVAMKNPDAYNALLAAAAPYQAPELFSGGDCTASTDIYALGVILFEMLTAEQPFRGSAAAPGHAHATAPVPAMRTFNAGVPQVLQELVEKAMAKTSSERYREAEEILLDLKAMRDSLRFGRPLDWSLKPQATPTPPPPPPRPTKQPAGVPRDPGRPSATAVRTTTEPPPVAKPQPSLRSERAEPDVPRWATMINVSLTILVVLALLSFAGYFFLNWTKPREVQVPTLMGKTEAEARGALAQRHLKLKINQKAINETFPPDTVYFSTPLAGTHVKEGSTVLVSISLGPRMIPVPDVKGMTEKQARDMLSEGGLRTVDVAPNGEYSDEVPEGAVSRQVPAPRMEVERSRKVVLYLSKGPKPDGETASQTETAVADTGGPQTWTIPVHLPRGGSDDVLVQVQFKDDDGERLVFDGYKSPGERFDVTAEGRGSEAAVTVLVDGKRIWWRNHLRPNR